MQVNFSIITLTATRSELQDIYRSIKNDLITTIDRHWKNWPVDSFLANETQRLELLKAIAHFSYGDYNTDLKDLLAELERARKSKEGS
jgi:hypothetical protein